VDFFLFWTVKEGLTDLSLGNDNLKETLVGVIRTFTSEKFTTATRRCFECREKCIRIDIGYKKKS
jgi:hypothetical protein